MKLSVIIPCLNAADTIKLQLEALANQHWSEPWEVIVADNGSTDSSMEIVKQYESRLPNLRIVDASSRRGQPYALNIGAKNAQGESLAFCDADDEVAPGWLAAMGGALSQHDFVACRIDVHKLSPPWVANTVNPAQASGIQPKGELHYLPHAGGGTIGVKRAIHEAIGGFDEELIYVHDTDYCWKVQLKGVALHFVPDAVMHIRLRGTIRGNYRQAVGWGQYRALLYKKHLPFGMPKWTWKQGIGSWKAFIITFVKSLPRIRSKSALVIWARRGGMKIGRLKGSIKYRVFAI